MERPMNKLKAIKRLVEGLKMRLKDWTPKTKHVFMEEDGNTYVAQRLNDPDAKEIHMNCQLEYDWEVYIPN